VDSKSQKRSQKNKQPGLDILEDKIVNERRREREGMSERPPCIFVPQQSSNPQVKGIREYRETNEKQKPENDGGKK